MDCGGLGWCNKLHWCIAESGINGFDINGKPLVLLLIKVEFIKKKIYQIKHWIQRIKFVYIIFHINFHVILYCHDKAVKVEG